MSKAMDDFVNKCTAAKEKNNRPLQEKIQIIKDSAHKVAYSCNVREEEVLAHPEKYAALL